MYNPLEVYLYDLTTPCLTFTPTTVTYKEIVRNIVSNSISSIIFRDLFNTLEASSEAYITKFCKLYFRNDDGFDILLNDDSVSKLEELLKKHKVRLTIRDEIQDFFKTIWTKAAEVFKTLRVNMNVKCNNCNEDGKFECKQCGMVLCYRCVDNHPDKEFKKL
jgi:hypothetical protein